jgi:hypothetical protein
MSCLDLIFGVAGPVSEALKVHHYNSGFLWTQYLQKKDQLKTLQLALKSQNLASAEARRAARELTVQIGELVTKINRETDLISVYAFLDKWIPRVEKAVDAIGTVESCAEKHNLLFTAHRVGEFIAGQIADMGLVYIEKRMIKAGLVAGEQVVELANFFIGFGYYSFRFSIAFNSVHTILADIDNASATAARLRSLHSATVRQMQSVGKELNELDRVQVDDIQAAKLLQRLRTDRRKTAYSAGIGTAYALAGGLEPRHRQGGGESP